MRGQSQPFGFAIYNKKNEVVVEIEDLCSLAKFTGILIGILLLSTVTIQQTAFLVLALFMLVFICFIKIAHEWSEWHAIEHKLIYLLENKLPLTIDNLKKAPMKQNERCGVGDKFLREPSTRKMNLALKAAKE